jgi:hypothetical protein
LASNIFEIFSRRLRMHIEKKYSAERDITPHRSTKTASNESLNYLTITYRHEYINIFKPENAECECHKNWNQTSMKKRA